MRVIVCGSRERCNEVWIWRKLDELNAERKFTHIMQGGANGVDKAAKDWARKTPGLERYECKADWGTHGDAAGPIRNSRMLEWKPDLVIAFPGERSIGTYDMVKKARAAGVETVVFLITTQG